MTEAPTQTGKKKLILRALLWLAGVCVIIFAAMGWYMTTDSFQRMVRARLVQELETVTGGRVELASIHTAPLKLEVEVRDLTIHGTELPNEKPLAHFNSITARIKIISALGGEFGFESLNANRPVVHVTVDKQGVTNIPERPASPSSGGSSVDKLFNLSIAQFRVRDGEILYNNAKIPLDFALADVRATARYSYVRRNYWIDASVGKAEAEWQNFRPFSWTASTQLRLGRNDMDIGFVKAASGNSTVEFRGKVSDFSDPKIEGDYKATADLAEVAAIGRRKEVTAGSLVLQGNGKWEKTDFSTSGTLMLNGINSATRYVALRGGDLTTKFAVTRDDLKLMGIDGHALGGNFAGNVQIQNWIPTLTVGAVPRNTKAVPQKGTIDLRFTNLSTPQVMAALSHHASELREIRLGGSTTGTVSAHWVGSLSNGEVDFNAEAVPLSRPGPGHLAIRASVLGKYFGASDDVDLARLSVTLPATELHASGRLSSSSALQFAISTRDLSEITPILAAFGSETTIPLTLEGPATFVGGAHGRLSDLRVQGRLETGPFNYLMPATEQAFGQNVRIDSLTAGVQVSARSIAVRNGVVHWGPTLIHFDGNANLDRGEFTDADSFSARISARNATVSEALRIAALDYPITGIANVNLQATGTKAQPHGEGHVEVSDLQAYGEKFQHASSDFSFEHDSLALRNFTAKSDAAHLSGRGNITVSTRAVQFEVAGSSFDLSRIPQLQSSKVPVEGQLDFKARASGTFEEPGLNADIQLRNLTFDRERAGDFHLTATTQGRELRVSGQSAFEHAELKVGGTVQLQGDLPGQINLSFNHLDIDPLLHAELRGRITGHSAVAGTIEAQGPLRTPRRISVTLEVPDFSADIQGLKLTNSDPILASFSNEVVQIKQLRLGAEGTEISAGGFVQLSGEQQIDLEAAGNLNLSLLETLNPDFTSSGAVALSVKVNGTLSNPVTHGRLQIMNASIAYIDLPSALSGLNGALVFNQDRLSIESLAGRVGGGQVSFGGYATAYQKRVDFDLKMHGEDVRLRYPPGISSNATADVRWTGSPKASTLSGDVTVNRLSIAPNFDFSSYVTSSVDSLRLPQTNPLLRGIKLDVHVVTAPELQLQTSSIRLSGDADLHLRGSAAKPVLLGRADILEGDAYFNGTRYRLERGDITFTNPATTTPIVDLQATTRVRDYDVTLNMTGPFDKLNLTYRSEPPLPSADVISLLALGRTQEESAQLQQSGQQPLGQAASNLILAEALNSAVNNRVQRLFGGSRIKIDPQGIATETSALARGPQVTIEQQLAHNFTVTYSTNVAAASQQIIQVEYSINRNISIVALRDQNGVVSFDLRVRRRKR